MKIRPVVPLLLSLSVVGIKLDAIEPLGRSAAPLNVKFDAGKADLVLDEQEKVDFALAVDELRSYPFATMTVDGYADVTGTDDINRKLSEDRAEAIRRYFVEQVGIAGYRISARGHSDAYPEATNATAEGRQENRRAVARIYRLTPKRFGTSPRLL